MVRQGVTLKDVAAEQFIREYAAHLKKSGKIELPAWHNLVKTSKAKELAPYDADWYYVRLASVARKIYIRGGSGVGALTKVYGSSERRGVCRNHFCKSSSGLLRRALQDLESLDIVTKADKGRKLTSNGRRTLDSIAARIVHGDK